MKGCTLATLSVTVPVQAETGRRADGQTGGRADGRLTNNVIDTMGLPGYVVTNIVSELTMGRDTLGEFEHQLLLAILQLGGEAYSVPLVNELEERTGREVAQAAVFIVLSRLEKKGLLTSRLDDHAAKQTGRVRRYFKPTPEALRRLKESRRALVRLWEGLDTTLDEA